MAFQKHTPSNVLHLITLKHKCQSFLMGFGVTERKLEHTCEVLDKGHIGTKI